GLPVLGSPKFTKLLTEDFAGSYGGCWAIEPDPHKIAVRMIDHIQAKREKLGISKAKERVLFDMEMRREMVDG
ncbi:MAG: carbon monoxide dehydrogenase, partial [Verrucomicrobia bacterium]|nr:carbon monoxide dehydrogenase [Verrucomicrobiota bacterium]